MRPSALATGASSGRWLALTCISVAQLMVALDATTINIALPTAQRALHISAPERQWVVTAYTLAFGGLLLLGGRGHDRRLPDRSPASRGVRCARTRLRHRGRLGCRGAPWRGRRSSRAFQRWPAGQALTRPAGLASRRLATTASVRVASVGPVRHHKADVAVIGAGVIGLTTAICLAEAGASVAVHAAEPPGQTTSAAAGALWGPHLVGADERIARWAGVTLDVLRELSGVGNPAAVTADARPSVHLAKGIAAARAANSKPPEFAAEPESLSACSLAEIPAGYRSGWQLSAPLVSMPEYLEYLHGRYLQAGGQPVVLTCYPTLLDAVRAADSRVLVNSSGSGAHGLVPDPDVTPVRGQVVVVSNPGLTDFFVGTGPGEGDLTYFFPHGDRVVMGGTEQHGNWSREPDQRTAARIIASCAAVEPALAGAGVLEHRVGLRPFRPRVRLEAEPTGAGTTIVHNYGHGGSGVTLSWGCAQDAARLALVALGG